MKATTELPCGILKPATHLGGFVEIFATRQQADSIKGSCPKYRASQAMTSPRISCASRGLSSPRPTKVATPSQHQRQFWPGSTPAMQEDAKAHPVQTFSPGPKYQWPTSAPPCTVSPSARPAKRSRHLLAAAKPGLTDKQISRSINRRTCSCMLR